MNRILFQKLSSVRVREARSLLEAGHYPGAYYLIGYAVECALKACISKKIKRHDFPDKKLVNEAHTHQLEKLVGIAELSLDFERDRKKNEELEQNWAVVTRWNESLRYVLSITSQEAIDLFSACTGKPNGILPWIRKRW